MARERERERTKAVLTSHRRNGLDRTDRTDRSSRRMSYSKGYDLRIDDPRGGSLLILVEYDISVRFNECALGE